MCKIVNEFETTVPNFLTIQNLLTKRQHQNTQINDQNPRETWKIGIANNLDYTLNLR